ncbi:MAG: elongation factor G [Clostridia bacterium]|nr:elongation factor G [Clostridia bacterium]MBO7245814.1 elongation factor G [Clostridia bacterium]MBO7737602.1 elongation factor G [Clostridia bacterium]
MAKYTSDKIRNICLMGHGGDGKTSLAESMLYLSKVTDRLGKTVDGNTVMDFDPEEIKRTMSVSASLANFEWQGVKINLVDTPGTFDFAGEVKQALRVVGTAILVVDGKSGPKVGTELCWDMAGKLPKAFFVNKMDDENASFERVFGQLRDLFGNTVCPVFVPYHEGKADVGFYNLLTEEAFTFDKSGKPNPATLPADMQDTMDRYKKMLDESLAETSDELIEKVLFNEESLTIDEKIVAMNAGLITGTIAPVFSGSAFTLAGVRTLMNIVAASFSSPKDRHNETMIDSEGNEKSVASSDEGDTSIFVFKTVADQFGKKSYFKVLNGTLKKDMVLTNLSTGQAEKIARIVTMAGKKETDVDELCFGDIGVTVKLANTCTNNTLSSNAQLGATYAPVEFPTPYLSMALVPKAKGDEDKISSGIAKLLEEDLTVKYVNNAETKQMCLFGLGDMHLDVIVSKLKNRFGTSVDLATPKVAYRETIKRSKSVQGKHKKQSGGHGQYGDVKIEFSRHDEDGLVFTETVVGGAVPKNFFPAIEKGLQESMQKGVLAGYPVIGLKANLFDGSYHDVDSSEMSFKLAANLAFKEGLKDNSVLLEPVGMLKVLIPDNMMGDIIGDLNKRRGRIAGTDQSEERKGYTVVEAEVPSAEMSTYAIQLRAMTQGRGTYTFEFLRYEEAPANIVQKVVEEAKKNASDE